MMSLTENMVAHITQLIQGEGNLTVPYGEHTIDLSLPWRRVTMDQLVKDATGADFYVDIQNNDYNSARDKAISLGIDTG